MMKVNSKRILKIKLKRVKDKKGKAVIWMIFLYSMTSINNLKTNQNI